MKIFCLKTKILSVCCSVCDYRASELKLKCRLCAHLKNSENVSEYPSAKFGAVKRKINDIKAILIFPAIDLTISEVRTKYLELQEKVQAFKKAYQSVLSACDNEQVRANIIDRYEKHCSEIDLAFKEIEDYFRRAGATENLPENFNLVVLTSTEKEYLLAPEDSASNISRSHSKSHLSKTSLRFKTDSIRIQLAERKAKLEADEAIEAQQKALEEANREMNKRKKKYEEEKKKQEEEMKKKARQLEDQRRSLKKQHELAYINSLQEQLSTLDDQGRSQLSSKREKNSVSSQNKKSVPSIANSKNSGSDQSAPLAQAIMMLAKNQQKLALPKNEPDCFDGTNIMKFSSFMHSFKTMIADHCDDDLDRLHYLEKYTAGLPQQLVRSCRKNNPSAGYKKAIETLEKEYGNEFKIAMAYIEKLENWPVMKAEDSVAMQELSVFLECCSNEMDENMTPFSQLNSPQQLKAIIMKLPYKIRDQ